MISNEINSIVAKLCSNPEDAAKFSFVCRAINSIWLGVPIEEDDMQGERYQHILSYMAENADFAANPKNVTQLKNFIKRFCLHAHNSGILLRNGVWLEKTFQVLIDMQAHPQLIFVASFIAILLVKPLYTVYYGLENGADSRSDQDVNSFEEERASVRAIVIATLEIVAIMLSYKISDNLIVGELRKLFKMFNTCDLVLKDEFFFEFYFKCLQTENYAITSTVLDNMRALLEDETVSEEGKAFFLSYMIRGDAPNILYWLATHKSLIIIEKTTHILLYVYRCDLAMNAWTSNHTANIFLNIFKKSNQVRVLSGQLLLEMLKKQNDHEKMLDIFEFYLRYKANPDEMPVLIDALWQFDYMKDINNIKNCFVKPTGGREYGETGKLRNALVGHFFVNMVERLSSESVEINFLRIMPRLIKVFRDSPTELLILLQALSKRSIPAMYDTLEDRRCFSQLLQQYNHIVLHSTDYNCTLMVMSILMEYKTIGCVEADTAVEDIRLIIFDDFLNFNLRWTMDEEGEDLLNNLEVVSMKLSIFLNTKYKLCAAENSDLCKTLINAIFTEEKFKNMTPNLSTIEIYYIESLCKLLMMKLIEVFTSKETDVEYLRNLKMNICQVGDRLLTTLRIESEMSLFKKEKVVKNLIHLIVSLPPSLQYCKHEELRCLADTLDNETFELIFEKCTKDVCDDELSDSTSIGFQRNILQHLTRFYTDYDGLEQVSREWKYFYQLLMECKLVKEVDELFLAVAKSKSPFDLLFRRIAAIISTILVRWGDEKINTKLLIARLVNLFKRNIADWQQLFHAITVTTIASLVRRTFAIPANRNRLLSLALLKAFFTSNTEFYAATWHQLSQFDDKILRGDEKRALDTFRQSIRR